MPLGVMVAGNPQVMALVGASVTPATWSGHSKSWAKWCQLIVSGDFPSGRDELLDVTLRYLVLLWNRGV